MAGDVDGLGWRSRVRAAVDGRGAVGFRRHRSHRLEYVDECPVASPAVTATGALARPVARRHRARGRDGDRRRAGRRLATRAGRRSASPTSPLVWSLGGKVRRPPGAVHAIVAGRTYRVSAGVFWQAHVGAAAALLEAVLDLAGDCRGTSVADLYAGAGLFSVPLADAAGPTDRSSPSSGTRGPAPTPGTTAPSFPHLRVLEGDVTPELVASAIGRPDVVVLDPAREGAGTDVMRSLGAHAATLRLLVYVSCDPASFGRDVRVLLDGGWRLTVLRAFDIFPMTEHVELVAALEPPGR